jgi:hypothetical protein
MDENYYYPPGQGTWLSKKTFTKFLEEESFLKIEKAKKKKNGKNF